MYINPFHIGDKTYRSNIDQTNCEADGAREGWHEDDADSRELVNQDGVDGGEQSDGRADTQDSHHQEEQNCE